MIHTTQNLNNLYLLLMKCFIECENINKYIQILEWIKQSNYKFKVRDIFIKKLINNCKNISDLQFINELIDNNLIENDGILFHIMLINACSNIGNINEAIKVFNKIENNKKDIICVYAMMTAYLNNEFYKNVLELYDYFSLNNIDFDIIAYTIVIKACSNIKNINKINKFMTELNWNLD